MIRVVLDKLRCPTPCVDMFADEQNARFSRWWGRCGEDAWRQDWGSLEGTGWCNPPFSVLDNVVDKCRAEGGNLILIAPDWQEKRYFQEMWPMSSSHSFFPVGTRLFELDGAEVPVIK